MPVLHIPCQMTARCTYHLGHLTSYYKIIAFVCIIFCCLFCVMCVYIHVVCVCICMRAHKHGQCGAKNMIPHRKHIGMVIF